MTQNAYDVPLQPLPPAYTTLPNRYGAPNATPQGVPTNLAPAPVNGAPGGVMPLTSVSAPGTVPPAAPGVPPAVAARKRKDAKKDVATKVGRQVLKSTPAANGTPPLPPNPNLENAPPEPTQKAAVQAPPVDPATGKPMAVPQQANTPYTAPTYQPPKKGLEYAAMALALLFPGAPIAKAAAGFAQGLNTGAEDKYKRATADAQQQYKVQQANAQNEYQNAAQRYGAASDEAKRAFINQQAANGADQATAEAAWKVKVDDLKRRQTLWTAGMGPDGKPIPLPPALGKALPANADASAYAAQATAQAKWYSDHGMSQKADKLSTEAQGYQKQVDEGRKFDQQLRVMDLRNIQADHLAQIREEGSVARAAAAGATRELAADARERSEFTSKANTAYSTAYSNLYKLTKGAQKADESGNPVPGAFAPPAIDKDTQGKLAATLRQIRASEDPAGLARYIAGQDGVPPAVADVIQSFGTAADLEKRGKGIAPPDLPDSYYDSMFKKSTGGAGAPTGIAADLKAMADAGADPHTNTQARGALVAKYGEAAVAKALGPSTPAHQSRADRAVAAQGAAVGHALTQPAPPVHNYHLPVTGQ